MADVVRLSMEVDARQIKKASDLLNKMSDAASSAGRQTKRFSNNAQQATKQTDFLSRSTNRLRGAVGLLTAGLAGLSFISLANDIQRATTQMNNINATMRVATGSALAAGEQISFIRQESERLGLFFPSVAKQMAQFAAAARTASITGSELRDIFSGISDASRAMGLTAPQAEGAMMALQQMMSKGKVSAEELRQQLGERMPGSIQIMASALDVTTSKLFDMMENGELLSDEVLPKFGRELQKVFGGQAIQQADRIAASIQRLRNSIFDLMSQGDLQGASDAINELAKVMSSQDFQNSFDSIIEDITKLAGAFARNIDEVIAFGKVLVAIGLGAFASRIVRVTSNMLNMGGAAASSSKSIARLAAKSTILSGVLAKLAGPAGLFITGAALILDWAMNSSKARKETRDWTEELSDLEERLGIMSKKALQQELQNAREAASGIVDAREELDRRVSILERRRDTGSSDEAINRAQIAVRRQRAIIRDMEAARRYSFRLQDQIDAAAANSRADAVLATRETSDARKKILDSLDSYRELVEDVPQIDLMPPGARDSLAAAGAEMRRVRKDLDLLSGSTEEADESLQDYTVTINDFVSGMRQVDLMPPGARDALATRNAQLEIARSETDKLKDKSEEYAESLQGIGGELNQILGQYDPIIAAATEYANQMTAVQNAVDAGLISQQKAEQLIGKITDQFQEAQNSATGLEKVLKDVASAVQDDISNGLTDIIMQAESAKDVFTDLLDVIAKTIIQQQIADPIAEGITSFAGGLDFGSMFGGGSGGSSFQGVGNAVPMNANGGNVYGNQPSIVGERGPEMFVPRQDGQIVPNSQMGGGGGDVTVNIINQSGERLESQEQNRRRGPNGEQTVDVMVKSSMERLDSQGQLDGIFRRHGAKRQGQF